MSVDFTIDHAGWVAILCIARARIAMNAAAGRLSLRASHVHTEERLHVVGAFCEYGVSMVEGKPIVCPAHAGSGWREATGGDDVEGWEVKGTERWNGRLLVPVAHTHKAKPEARYLLVYANLRELKGRIVGWAYGSDFLDNEHIASRLPVPAYTPSSLRSYPLEPAKPPR